MATFLDAGLLSHFNVVFVFLFVLVAVYAILIKIKMFGDNQFVNSVIALVMAVMFASSNTTAKVFSYAAPWFVLLFLVLLVLQLMFAMMGGKDSIITADNPTTTSIIAIFILMIFFLSISQVTHENKEPLVDSGVIQEGEPTTFPGKVGEIVRNPSVLGLILVLLIATFAIAMLTLAPVIHK